MAKAKSSTKFDQIFETKVKRKFTFLPVIDSYIFREFLIIYACCMMAFCMLFLIGDLINNLGDFLSPQATIWGGISYFLLKQPGDILFVLPLSLMLACLYTMAKMGMNNEITAMRASGISLVRCGASIYVVALIVTGVNYWFNESLVPRCNMEAQIILKSIGNPNYFKKLTSMLMYRSPDNQRTWLVKSFESLNDLNEVQLKKYDSKARLQLELYAPKGSYSEAEGWKFFDATLVKYKDIALNEDFRKDEKKARQTFVVPVTTKVSLLDKNSPDYSSLGTIIEDPEDIINTIKDPNEITTGDIMRRLAISKELDPLSKNTLKTELATRFAFPWVCILSVMVAVPIAGKNMRRGIMVSVISAVSVIIIYLTISQLFQILGNRGIIPPFIAGTLPTIGLAIYAWKYINKNK